MMLTRFCLFLWASVVAAIMFLLEGVDAMVASFALMMIPFMFSFIDF